MFIEYRFTHTYEDKFSRPFSKSIRLAEKEINKLSSQTDFVLDNTNKLAQAFDKVSKKIKFPEEKFKILPEIKNLKIPHIKDQDLEIIPKVERINIPTIEGKSFKIFPEVEDVKFPNIKDGIFKVVPEVRDIKLPTIEDKTFKISPKIEKANIPDIEDKTFKIIPEVEKRSLYKMFKPEKTYTFSPELALKEKFKKEIQKIKNDFKEAGYIKIKTDDKELKRIEKKNLQIEADIKPDTNELKKVENKGLSLNLFMANINTGDTKEQLLSFSESLFEATKYGLKKAELGKAIAQEVKNLDGLVSMPEMGNAIVAALHVGIRGTEKELAEYGKEIQKFHYLTGKSYEESAQLIYKLKDKFKLPVEGIEKTIDEIAVLRKNFAITEDDLTNALSSVKDEFGSLMASMDKKTKLRFTDQMLRFSAALEQMHISAKDSFDLINKALSEGDSQAIAILSQGGMSFSQLQKAMQEGKIEDVANAYQKAIIKIGTQLKNASPIVRKQLMEMYGLSEEMANSFIEAASNAQEFQKQTEKAFSIKVNTGEVEKQWEEATNPFTKGIQKIKNEIMGFLGDKLPSDIFDGFSSASDLFLLYLGSKGIGKILPSVGEVGTKFGGKLIGGIKNVFTKSHLPTPSIKDIAKTTINTKGISEIASGVSKVSKFAKVLEKIPKLGKIGLIGSIAGALTIGSAIASDSKDKTIKVSKAVGSVGGSMAGAAIGATIGSIIPVVGTTIGGIAGSFIGGFLGEKVGELVGSFLDGNKKEEEDTTKLDKPILNKSAVQEIKESKKDDLLNAIYTLQSQLANIDNNTALLQQLNVMMSQYIELLKLMMKNNGENIEDIVFKGFNR